MSEIALNASPRMTAAKWGAGVALLTAAYDVYGVYGGTVTTPQNQKDGLPFVIAIALVLTALVFGLLVPAGLRSVDSHSAGAAKWMLGLGIAAFVSLVAFWSGAPIILGAAAIAVAGAGIRHSGGSAKVAIGLGGFAAGLSIVWTVVSSFLPN
jgi:hypothetical protein